MLEGMTADEMKQGVICGASGMVPSMTLEKPITMVSNTTVNILGTDYTVVQTSRDAEKRLKDCDGFCDKTTKEIVISIDTEDSDLSNFDWYRRKILRHEIVHAFFMESGLQENFESKPYGIMETLVDWIAIQFPKMQKVFAELDIL